MNRFQHVLLGTFLAVSVLFPTAISSGEDSVFRILVLYSHRQSVPINDQWESGLREGMGSLRSQSVTWENEYLDFQRVQDPAARTHLLTLVEEKYEQAKPDLVVVVHDSVANEFANREWFPGIPVVFCSVLQETIAPFRSNARMAGVIYRLRAKRTVEAIMGVLPDTQRVIVVSGIAELDQNFFRMIADELENLTRPKIEYWNGIPPQQMHQDASKLDRGTVLLFNTFMRDNNGEAPKVPRDIAKDLAKASSVPLFGLYDTMMGTGVVGGCMESARSQGFEAGSIAARILDGEKPDQIGFVELPAPWLEVDWNQLKRWNIREASLPEGTKILNRQKSVFEQYPYLILGALSLIGLQSFMIFGLLWSRQRRIKIESELQSSRNEAYELAGKVLTAQEDERRRIAREMHDDIAQRLVAVSLETQMLERTQQSPHAKPIDLSLLYQQIVAISRDIRDLSREIHPAVLEDLGLIQALEVEVQRLRKHSTIDIQFFRPAELPHLTQTAELCLYRTAQEALRNAMQHSGSSRVFLRLATDAEGVELSVEDFGAGFDSSKRDSHTGIGLHTMQERARLAGGTLEVNSKSVQGTVVSVRIPISDEP